MPLPNSSLISNTQNRLVYDELAYNKASLESEHENLFTNPNEKQVNVYNEVMNEVSNDQSGIFLVYGYGDTWKTYIWQTLSFVLAQIANQEGDELVFKY